MLALIALSCFVHLASAGDTGCGKKMNEICKNWKTEGIFSLWKQTFLQCCTQWVLVSVQNKMQLFVFPARWGQVPQVLCTPRARTSAKLHQRKVRQTLWTTPLSAAATRATSSSLDTCDSKAGRHASSHRTVGCRWPGQSPFIYPQWCVQSWLYDIFFGSHIQAGW